ncbi:unnamed protein product [Nippostrongylus brasiliensis]|uniref:Uncharacterized protein n=1 Tax=Nippostrongylus brasiliensis TaxID=27835 RepID=A0A0N4Y7U4_NIPBR|nr:unnamed protein product [Nippostrongylus brasiliensis]
MNALLAGTALLLICSTFAATTEECTRGFVDTYPASENEDLAEDIKMDLGFQVDNNDEMTTFAAKHDGKHEVFVKVDKKGNGANLFFKYELIGAVDGPFERIDEQEFTKYEQCKVNEFSGPVEDSN